MAMQGASLQYYSIRSKNKGSSASPSDIKYVPIPTRKRFSLNTVTAELARNIDIRFLLVGSLLPDIIDKPLGLLHFGSGRSIGHTLLFLLIFTFIGLFLYFTHKWKRMLVLAGGIFTHLILDSMWRNPNMLIWPLRGAHFATGTTSDWLSSWGNLLIHDPAYYICESIGFIIICYFTYWLFKQKKVVAFIKNGYL